MSIYDIMMKPVHDINFTKHSKSYLKTRLKARLSILILSKANRVRVYNTPLTRHARLMKALGFTFAEKQLSVGPYFQVLAFRF